MKRFIRDQKVFMPKQYMNEVKKTQRLDTVMIDGYIASDGLIVCTDFFNVSAAFEHQQVSFLRNKNRLTAYRAVSSRVKLVCSGHLLMVVTETEVKTECEVSANKWTQNILAARENDRNPAVAFSRDKGGHYLHAKDRES